jgi:hypothetical protein
MAGLMNWTSNNQPRTTNTFNNYLFTGQDQCVHCVFFVALVLVGMVNDQVVYSFRTIAGDCELLYLLGVSSIGLFNGCYASSISSIRG